MALQADRDWFLKEFPFGTPPRVTAFLEPSHCPSSTLCNWVERHTCQSYRVYLSVFCCFSFWSLRGAGDEARGLALARQVLYKLNCSPSPAFFL